ncbi:MAG: response regulator [Anaerolineales bacterium]|nr:MAG: response regulator [Anaerolineales bacterium]
MAKILIAEDERDIRNLIAISLEHAGHEVITTVDGESALEQVYTERPDLVLLDVRMPRLDGYEVCRRIKLDLSLRKIPVAFLSAKGQKAEIEQGLQAGAEAYIIKPFSLDTLLSTVAKLLKA